MNSWGDDVGPARPCVRPRPFHLWPDSPQLDANTTNYDRYREREYGTSLPV